MPVSEKHISRRLRDNALRSIDTKREVLSRWLRRGIPIADGGDGGRMLEWFPTSLRTFCAWDGSQNQVTFRAEVVGVKKNAYQTLASDPDRLRDVNVLIEAVKKLAEVERKRLNPKCLESELRAQIHLEREKRKGALLGYRSARSELREMRLKYSREVRAHQQSMEQFHRINNDYERETAELRAKVGELTAMVKKITTIKSV